MPNIESSPMLDVRRVGKRFTGVQALRDVNLELGRGEVLAVIGENGAGKSTLVKILAGVERPDEGEILLDGKPVEIDSVEKALRLGIVLIHQELNLAENLDVGANIFLGREPTRWGLVDKRQIALRSRGYLQKVGFNGPPERMVHKLSIGERQLVEIAKALSTGARILIMDEPTSSLSQRESEALFRVVRDLRAEGVGVIYISHRLGEVRELADRVVVLRDGENSGGLRRDEIDHERMVRMMVGRDLARFYSRREHAVGEPVLEVEDLVVSDKRPFPLRFAIRAGEMVGVAGLVGAGRSEMLAALFGVEPPRNGAIRIDGKAVRLRSPRDAIRASIALVPEDRKAQGLILEMTVRENIGLPGLWRNRLPGGFLNGRRELRDADEMIRQMRVKTPSREQVVRFLSGGNQQKVVLAKWLALGPRVLLLDEPTRGIDVGAKEEIYSLMERLAESGMAILFVSSEMEEILGMSDRAMVMHEGRIAGWLQRGEITEEAVILLATGGK